MRVLEKLLVIILLMTLSLGQDTDVWPGKWKVQVQDDDCESGCCCPKNTFTLTRDPNNATNLLVKGDFVSSQVCESLGVNRDNIWPFTTAVSSSSNVYNPSGEQFDVSLYRKQEVKGKEDLYAEIIIDDTKVEVEGATYCYVTIVKVSDDSWQSLLSTSLSMLAVLTISVYLF